MRVTKTLFAAGCIFLALIVVADTVFAEEAVTYAPSNCVLCGKEVYTLYLYEDVVGRFPVEACAIFFLIVISSALVEWVIDALAARGEESEFFEAIVSSIKQEALVSSLIGMLIIGAKSIGALSDRWSLMLNYSILCMFYMIVFMVMIVTIIVLSLSSLMRNLRNAEGVRLDDPNATLTSKEELFKKCRERFRESLLAKDFKNVDQVLFADYILTVQKHTMKAVTDLGWKCWSGLAACILGNGIRSRLTAPKDKTADQLTSQDYLVNIFSYIMTVGYITLAIFLILHFLLQSRVKTFAENQAARKAPDGSWIVVDSSTLLFFGGGEESNGLESTAHIFQTVILVLEWYFAVFVLAMVSDAFRVFGAGGLGFIVLAVIPLVVFGAVFPWTICLMSMLDKLGTGIDTDAALELLDQAGEQEKHNKQLTQADADEQNKKKTEFRAGKGVADEWDGAQVSLHSVAANPSALDTGVPNIDSKQFRHPNAVELHMTRKVKLEMMKREQAARDAEKAAKDKATGASSSASKSAAANAGPQKIGVLSLPKKRRDPPTPGSPGGGLVDNDAYSLAMPSAEAASSGNTPLLHKSRPIDPLDEL